MFGVTRTTGATGPYHLNPGESVIVKGAIKKLTGIIRGANVTSAAIISVFRDIHNQSAPPSPKLSPQAKQQAFEKCMALLNQECGKATVLSKFPTSERTSFANDLIANISKEFMANPSANPADWVKFVIDSCGPTKTATPLGKIILTEIVTNSQDSSILASLDASYKPSPAVAKEVVDLLLKDDAVGLFALIIDAGRNPLFPAPAKLNDPCQINEAYAQSLKTLLGAEQAARLVAKTPLLYDTSRLSLAVQHFGEGILKPVAEAMQENIVKGIYYTVSGNKVTQALLRTANPSDLRRDLDTLLRDEGLLQLDKIMGGAILARLAEKLGEEIPKLPDRKNREKLWERAVKIALISQSHRVDLHDHSVFRKLFEKVKKEHLDELSNVITTVGARVTAKNLREVEEIHIYQLRQELMTKLEGKAEEHEKVRKEDIKNRLIKWEQPISIQSKTGKLAAIRTEPVITKVGDYVNYIIGKVQNNYNSYSEDFLMAGISDLAGGNLKALRQELNRAIGSENGLDPEILQRSLTRIGTLIKAVGKKQTEWEGKAAPLLARSPERINYDNLVKVCKEYIEALKSWQADIALLHRELTDPTSLAGTFWAKGVADYSKLDADRLSSLNTDLDKLQNPSGNPQAPSLSEVQVRVADKLKKYEKKDAGKVLKPHLDKVTQFLAELGEIRKIVAKISAKTPLGKDEDLLAKLENLLQKVQSEMIPLQEHPQKNKMAEKYRLEALTTYTTLRDTLLSMIVTVKAAHAPVDEEQLFQNQVTQLKSDMRQNMTTTLKEANLVSDYLSGEVELRVKELFTVLPSELGLEDRLVFETKFRKAFLAELMKSNGIFFTAKDGLTGKDWDYFIQKNVENALSDIWDDTLTTLSAKWKHNTDILDDNRQIVNKTQFIKQMKISLERLNVPAQGHQIIHHEALAYTGVGRRYSITLPYLNTLQVPPGISGQVLLADSLNGLARALEKRLQVKTILDKHGAVKPFDQWPKLAQKDFKTNKNDILALLSEFAKTFDTALGEFHPLPENMAAVNTLLPFVTWMTTANVLRDQFGLDNTNPLTGPTLTGMGKLKAALERKPDVWQVTAEEIRPVEHLQPSHVDGLEKRAAAIVKKLDRLNTVAVLVRENSGALPLNIGVSLNTSGILISSRSLAEEMTRQTAIWKDVTSTTPAKEAAEKEIVRLEAELNRTFGVEHTAGDGGARLNDTLNILTDYATDQEILGDFETRLGDLEKSLIQKGYEADPALFEYWRMPQFIAYSLYVKCKKELLELQQLNDKGFLTTEDELAFSDRLTKLEEQLKTVPPINQSNVTPILSVEVDPLEDGSLNRLAQMKQIIERFQIKIGQLAAIPDNELPKKERKALVRQMQGHAVELAVHHYTQLTQQTYTVVGATKGTEREALDLLSSCLRGLKPDERRDWIIDLKARHIIDDSFAKNEIQQIKTEVTAKRAAKSRVITSLNVADAEQKTAAIEKLQRMMFRYANRLNDALIDRQDYKGSSRSRIKQEIDERVTVYFDILREALLKLIELTRDTNAIVLLSGEYLQKVSPGQAFIAYNFIGNLMNTLLSSTGFQSFDTIELQGNRNGVWLQLNHSDEEELSDEIDRLTTKIRGNMPLPDPVGPKVKPKVEPEEEVGTIVQVVEESESDRSGIVKKKPTRPLGKKVAPKSDSSSSESEEYDSEDETLSGSETGSNVSVPPKSKHTTSKVGREQQRLLRDENRLQQRRKSMQYSEEDERGVREKSRRSQSRKTESFGGYPTDEEREKDTSLKRNKKEKKNLQSKPPVSSTSFPFDLFSMENFPPSSFYRSPNNQTPNSTEDEFSEEDKGLSD